MAYRGKIEGTNSNSPEREKRECNMENVKKIILASEKIRAQSVLCM